MLFSNKFKVYSLDYPPGLLDVKFNDKKGIEYVRVKFTNWYAEKEYFVDVPMYRVTKIERVDGIIAKAIKSIFKKVPAQAMIAIGRIVFSSGWIMLYLHNHQLMTACFSIGVIIWFFGWEKKENKSNK